MTDQQKVLARIVERLLADSPDLAVMEASYEVSVDRPGATRYVLDVMPKALAELRLMRLDEDDSRCTALSTPVQGLPARRCTRDAGHDGLHVSAAEREWAS